MEYYTSWSLQVTLISIIWGQWLGSVKIFRYTYYFTVLVPNIYRYIYIYYKITSNKNSSLYLRVEYNEERLVLNVLSDTAHVLSLV